MSSNVPLKDNLPIKEPLPELLLAKLVGPTGHVYAFEASPKNFAILEKNER